MRFLYLVILISLPLVLSNCRKPEPDQPPPVVNPDDRQLLILNEGTFNFGNAGLGIWNLDQRTYQDLFQPKNNRPLGDVAQSISEWGGLLYLVINNSGRIEIISKQDGSSQGIINGLKSPRYIAFLSDHKAYVSDLYDEAIAIVNPAERKVIGKIPFPGWGEGMVLTANRLFVSNVYRNYLYVIDPGQDKITDSIRTSLNAYQVVASSGDYVFSLCAGDPPALPASLYRVNKNNLQVDSLVFPAAAEPSHLQINPTGDAIFWTDRQQVYTMSINATQLPGTAMSGIPVRNWYHIEPAGTHGLYLTDALDYVQNGWVFRYDMNTGSITDSIRAGIIPRDIFILK